MAWLTCATVAERVRVAAAARAHAAMATHLFDLLLKQLLQLLGVLLLGDVQLIDFHKLRSRARRIAAAARGRSGGRRGCF